MHVLLVDDFEPFRKWLASQLQIEGLELVSEASDGIEAVQMAKELQPKLIFMDIGLPRLNGIEAARKIQAVSPGSRILFLSADSSPTMVEEALSLNTYFSYVAKQDAASEFRAAMDALLRGESYVSSSARVTKRLQSGEFD